MHSLVLGVTRTGKTTLAKALAEEYQQRNVATLVLDPNNDPDWPCDPRHRFTDPQLFLRVAKASRRCALFVDESGASIGRGKQSRGLEWLTTRSRHWGHICYIIGQRATQVEPTVRNQCDTAYVFRQAPSDARELADHFADEALLQASTLGVGEFLYVRSCEKTLRMKLKI